MAQNYADEDIKTKVPTIQRFSYHIDNSLAASLLETRTYTRYITPAYIQSISLLERNVYIRSST